MGDYEREKDRGQKVQMWNARERKTRNENTGTNCPSVKCLFELNINSSINTEHSF